MNPTRTDSGNRRRTRYVDTRLQRWLIIGLSLVQVLAVGVALVYLDGALRELLQSSIYRVHLPPGGDVQTFAATLMKSFALVLMISATALVLADWMWSSHLNEALESMAELSRRTRALDFRADAGPVGGHELLARYRDWRDSERQLMIQVRESVNDLRDRPGLPAVEAQERLQALRARLGERLGVTRDAAAEFSPGE